MLFLLAFIGDEDAPRNVVGRNRANIRVLPNGRGREAPSPSTTTSVLAERNTIYDGQTARFFYTGAGGGIGSVNYRAPGIRQDW